MAKKYIDIMPPYPKKERTYHRESPAKKQKRKSKSLFFTLIMIVILATFCYVFLKAGTQSTTPVDSGSNSNTNTSTNEFELFDNQGQSSLTGKTGVITIRITDGATNANTVNTVRDALLVKGYQIEKMNKSSAPYAQTFIYYKRGDLGVAQKIKDILSSNFNADIQESTNLENSYDILIIVGNS